MILDALPHESPEWHADRATGIGGSEIPIIARLTPDSWGTPTDIWALKVHGTKTDVTEPMLWGTRLEDIIIDAWCDREGIDPATVDRQKRARHDTIRFVRATLDGIIQDGVGTLIEVKNVSSWPWDEIPDYYRAQCIWQMGCTGATESVLVALHRGNQLADYRIEFDARVFDRLVDIGATFWQHVLDGRAPDGSIDADAALADMVRRYAALGRERRDIEAAEKDLKADIALALDGHTEARLDGVPLVTRKPTVRQRVDTDRLIDAHAQATGLDPDTVRAAYTTTQTLYTIRPGKAAK